MGQVPVLALSLLGLSPRKPGTPTTRARGKRNRQERGGKIEKRDNFSGMRAAPDWLRRELKPTKPSADPPPHINFLCLRPHVAVKTKIIRSPPSLQPARLKSFARKSRTALRNCSRPASLFFNPPSPPPQPRPHLPLLTTLLTSPSISLISSPTCFFYFAPFP